MIDIEDIITRLLQLPQEMAAAEREVLQAEASKRHAANVLQAREDTLLLTEVQGKNAEERAAKLRVGTVTEQLLLEQAEQKVSLVKALLHELQAEHSSLRAVARLLAADTD